MKVYTVFGICGRVPTDIEVFADSELARARGLELAADSDLLQTPWDWHADDGEWRSEDGSMRSWHHHWYNDEHDVVVAECEVR